MKKYTIQILAFSFLIAEVTVGTTNTPSNLQFMSQEKAEQLLSEDPYCVEAMEALQYHAEIESAAYIKKARELFDRIDNSMQFGEPWPPIGKLGVPLGTLVEIKGEIVDGNSYARKAWTSSYLIEVSHINDAVLDKKRLLRFALAPYPKLPYPNESLALYELKKGHKAKGWVDSKEIAELQKGYVGKQIHLRVWEKGMFSGIPQNMPADSMLWQDHGFGFSTWLVLLEDLSTTRSNHQKKPIAKSFVELVKEQNTHALPQNSRKEKTEPPLYPIPSTTNSISRIDIFAFGGVGFRAATCEGETLFKKISPRRNALEQFVNLYGLAQENDEAKMYAMVGFYYLNRPLYNHIKTNYKTTDILIATASGCLYCDESLACLLKQLESGDFETYVPKRWKQ